MPASAGAAPKEEPGVLRAGNIAEPFIPQRTKPRHLPGFFYVVKRKPSWKNIR
jgi:hypothetical protein